jgi:hypothetical protein
MGMENDQQALRLTMTGKQMRLKQKLQAFLEFVSFLVSP